VDTFIFGRNVIRVIKENFRVRKQEAGIANTLTVIVPKFVDYIYLLVMKVIVVSTIPCLYVYWYIWDLV
jgi:hypothetical protein